MTKRAFNRYFEWIGDKIYIRVNGRDTTTSLNSLFSWFENDRPRMATTDEVDRLKAELNTLWNKHNRLLTYLGLEDVTTPERKEIRKIKNRVVRAAPKPKQQTKAKRASPAGSAGISKEGEDHE